MSSIRSGRPGWRALALLLLASAAPGLPAATRGDRLDAAIHSGIAWAVDHEHFELGDLWGLSMLDDDVARQKVKDEIEKTGGQLGPYSGLVVDGADGGEFPEAWRPKTPDDDLHMAVWIYWAANAPGRTPPPEVVHDLIGTYQGGYKLTHQYLSLRILHDRGCASGSLVDDALDRLLNEIEREQRAAPWYSDLAAERVAVLLFGGRTPPELDAWIEILLEAQGSTHHWRVPPHPYSLRLDDMHATLVSLWALDQYRRLAPPD